MADETIVTSALTMDRGLALGNSPGTDTRRRLHVKVDNLGSEPVPVTLSGVSALTPKLAYAEVLGVASAIETDIVSYTVPVGETFFLTRVDFSGSNIGTYRVKVNGLTIDKRHTWFNGPMFGTMEFSDGGIEGPEYAAGDVIKLTAVHSRPFVGDFNGKIQGNEP